jgi:prepilin-type N-terminal cleavage/methylation domain-containing protein
MMKRGFTIIELIITITVMTVLLTLALVNLKDSQMQARDSERKEDIKSIANSLEAFYDKDSSLFGYSGTYPYAGVLTSSLLLSKYLPDLDQKDLMTPGQNTNSIVIATNNNQTASGIQPYPSVDQYVYQPLNQSGSLCLNTSSICVKYNLFYKLESSGLIAKETSKNQ